MVTRRQAPPGRDPHHAVRRYAHVQSASRAAAGIRAHTPAEVPLPEVLFLNSLSLKPVKENPK